MSDGRDFWSRRRAAVEAETMREADREIEAERAALARRDDTEILQELNLPDPDSLAADDDIRAFMGELVPDRLRRRALRRLWRLNPVLANVDGLVEYGEDFTDSATVIDNLQTAYEVGKGMLSHIEALAAEAEAEEPRSGPAPDPDPPVSLAGTEPEASPAADTGDEAVPAGDPEEPVAPPAPRRMRFAFPQDGTRQRT
jgi:hypothetical protein